MSKQAVKLKVSKPTAECITPDAPKDVRMLAASGKLPVEPRELLTALYFLANDKDPEVKMAAKKSIAGIPRHVLNPLLSSPDAHPKVIDYISRLLSKETSLLEIIIGSKAADEITLARIVERADITFLETISNDKELFTRHPALFDAVKKNPVVTAEIVVRVGQTIEEIEQGGTADDEAELPKELLKEKTVEEPEEEDKGSIYKQILTMGTSEKIVLAMKGNKEARGILVKEPNRLICGNVMKNARITESEVVLFAGSKTVGAEVFRAITMNKDWMKNYQVKLNLVQNPRVPLPTAMNLLNKINAKDLQLLSKSRNVSKGVANMAKKMIDAKEAKKKKE